MAMIHPDNTPTRIQRAVCPSLMQGREYIKFEEGMEKTIISVVYSVYVAKNKQTKDPIQTKNGSYIMNVTAYIEFDDGTYGSVKNDIAIGQLISLTGSFPEDTEGQYVFTEFQPQKVRVVSKDVKYGDKLYKSWVFIPIE